MNFLAHSFLSFEYSDLMIGNFIADAVKGKQYHNYSEGIQKGINLHREIDRYTDNHIIVKKLYSELKPYFSRYSGVVIDIYFDHFLARNWTTYCDIPLHKFVREVYKHINRHFIILPAKTKRILPFMITQNWLEGYAEEKGLRRVFEGMSRRAKFNSGMEDAVNILFDQYKTIEKDFTEFFPDMIAHSKEQLINLNSEINDWSKV